MKKKIIIYSLALIIILIGIMVFILDYGYSTGVRTGRLVKLSKIGVLYKTYEGTLDLGSGDELTWQFSIHDDDLGDKLIKQTGKKVQLKYKEHFMRLFYRTKYNVIQWQFADEEMLELLCRFVAVVKTRSDIVNALRPLIKDNDPALLFEIRKCQNQKK